MPRHRLCVHDIDDPAIGELSDFLTVGMTKSREDLRTIIGMENVTILIIDLDGDDALDAIVEVLEIKSDIAVIGVTGSQDVQKVIMAQRAGCRQIAGKPLNADDLRVAIRRATHHAEDLSSMGKTIAVMGATGGAGATTFASYLTMSIKELTNAPTAIMDLDLEFGSVARIWDMNPRCTIAEVLKAHSIDRLMLEDAITELPPGVGVLARPTQLEQCHQITDVHVGKIIEATRTMYPNLVIDLPRKMDAISGCAIQAARKLIVVLQLTANGIFNAGRLTDSLVRFGLSHDVLEFVVNRYRKGYHNLTIEALEERIGKKVLGIVPNNYKALFIANDVGQPISDRDPVRRSIQEIAARICGIEPRKSSRSWNPIATLSRKREPETTGA